MSHWDSSPGGRNCVCRGKALQGHDLGDGIIGRYGRWVRASVVPMLGAVQSFSSVTGGQLDQAPPRTANAATSPSCCYPIAT